MSEWVRDGQNFATLTWNMLVDGGTWAVPRSGLIYRKDETNARLVLYARMPWDPELPWTPAQLHEQQNSEHAGIREGFAAIGVEVTDEST